MSDDPGGDWGAGSILICLAVILVYAVITARAMHRCEKRGGVYLWHAQVCVARGSVLED